MATAAGSYTGDNATNRTITLPFTPKLVIVNGELAGESTFISNVNTGTRGFALPNVANPVGGTAHTNRPGLTTNGFVVSGSSAGTPNFSGRVFHYYAIG